MWDAAFENLATTLETSDDRTTSSSRFFTSHQPLTGSYAVTPYNLASSSRVVKPPYRGFDAWRQGYPGRRRLSSAVRPAHSPGTGPGGVRPGPAEGERYFLWISNTLTDPGVVRPSEDITANPIPPPARGTSAKSLM